MRSLIRWKSDETEPPDRGAWESSRARGLHDDRCLRQLFIPCQIIEEIADSGTTAVQNGQLVLATQTGLVRFDGVPFQ
jgi:ABC-type arginine transport system permease subunit